MNKKISILSKLLLILVVSVGLLSGCSVAEKSFDSTTNQEYEDKNQVISITGKLSQNGEFFFITDNLGEIHDIETYSVSFKEYIGKFITATGQYSGDTLYVTEISE